MLNMAVGKSHFVRASLFCGAGINIEYRIDADNKKIKNNLKHT
jgi:hypothetical protein